MRRDFSIVLAAHGLDLDRALRRRRAQPDYSMADHARDLAGALRWNAIGAIRGQRRSPARARAGQHAFLAAPHRDSQPDTRVFTEH